MAYRKASEEPKAVALGSADFWAAVQGGVDVQIGVGDILDYLRRTLQITDTNGLQAALDAIEAKSAADLSTALGDLDGSVKAKLDALGTASRLDVGAGPNQVPQLDGNGQLLSSTLPALAISDTFPVASQAAMLAVAAERGDIAIRSDLNKCFILQKEPASTLANWKELLTPTDAVLSVAGLTGVITGAALKTALGIAVGDVAGLQTALTALRTDVDNALATKLDKAGGTISGGLAIGNALSVEGAVTAKNGVTIVAATDAVLQLEDTTAPETTFRRKTIRSSKNVSGGNGWLFRQQRPSDGAVQDFTLSAPGEVWTTGNFDPATKANAASTTAALATKADATATTNALAGKASLNGNVSFNVLAVTQRPTWGAFTPWDNGNFDPGSKLDKSGGVLSGQLMAKASVAGSIASRSGDGSFLQVKAEDGQGAAAMVFHRGNSYATWFGLDTDNEFKFGGWSEGAVAQRFWTSKNFNPATKLDVGGSPRFNGVSFGTGDTYVYADAGQHHFVVRTGAASAMKYSIFNADGSFTGAGTIKAQGYLIATDRVVVGEGQTSSYIEMRDTDEGTRFVHNNGGTIGFLTSGGNWGFRMYDTGAIWTAQLGDLNTRIEDRAAAWSRQESVARANERLALSGGRMTGDFYVEKAYPMMQLLYPNVKWWGMQVRENGWLYFPENNNANHNIAFVPGGNIWSNAWGGYITDHINNRASAYAAERVAKTGDSMSGDLTIGSKTYPQICLLWGGVVRAGWMLDSDGSVMWRNADNGDVYQRLYTNGAIWTKQFGDLNNRIEDRAYAHAVGQAEAFANNRLETATNRINNKSFRLAYAGDLNSTWNENANNFGEPYGGAVLTTMNWYAQGGLGHHVSGARWRYCQMSDSNGNWYTCGYV